MVLEVSSKLNSVTLLNRTQGVQPEVGTLGMMNPQCLREVKIHHKRCQLAITPDYS